MTKEELYEKVSNDMYEDYLNEYMRDTDCSHELDGYAFAHEIVNDWRYENPIKDFNPEEWT